MDFDDRILRRLKLSDLRLLSAVVQLGGMAKAANRLNISQPAVSKAISALEHTLGVRLLDRKSSGVEPTIYGQALLGGSAAVFDELRQRVKQIEFLSDPSMGELRIGSNSAQTAGMVSLIIKRILRKHRRIVFHVTEGETFTLLNRDLRERSIDLVLGRIPATFSEDDMEVHNLCNEQLHVVSGVQNSWASRRRIQLGELVDCAWVLPPFTSLVGSMIADAFRLKGHKAPQPSVVTLSIQLTKDLLTSGPYLGMFPESLLRFGSTRTSLKSLPVDLSIRPRSLAIIVLKNRTVSPVTKLFIDYARQATKPLAEAR
jgi:DNA-binding transcriptional LysR family regulator